MPLSSPTSSPLAHRNASGSKNPMQMYQPALSSPLSSSDRSSPTFKCQIRKRQYKSKSPSMSSKRFSSLNVLGPVEDTTQKQFLRERFKAQCMERVKEGRARARIIRRDESSSDGFDVDGDFAMDEDEDILDDEIYKRVMLNEVRRMQHAKRVSFERDFGSSIDPSMYDDMDTLEMELTGKAGNGRTSSPPLDDFDLDDELIQEYLAELEEPPPQQELRHSLIGCADTSNENLSDFEHEFTTDYPSPSRSMYSDFEMSSPPSTPSRSNNADASTWKCPFCLDPASRSYIACQTCVTQYSLDHAQLFWFDANSHPGVGESGHAPIASRTPEESGVKFVIMCAAPKCDWCYAL